MPPWDPKKPLQVVWQRTGTLPRYLSKGVSEGTSASQCLKCFEFLCATPVAEPLCQGEPGVRERERRPKWGGLCSLRSHLSHRTDCQQFTATEMDVGPEWNCLEGVGIISGFCRNDPALSRRKLSFDLKAWELGNSTSRLWGSTPLQLRAG